MHDVTHAPKDQFAAGLGHGPGLLGPWMAVAILTALNMLSFIDRLVLTLLAVPIQKDLHLTDIQLGLLQGFAFALFYASAGLPIGWLVDRFSRRAIIFGGVTIWSLCTMAGGLTRSFTGLIAIRAGVGAGEAALSPSAFSLITDLFPRERLAMAISVFFLGANLGAALSLVFGGLILAALTRNGGLDLPIAGHLAPWQATLFLIGAPGLLLGSLVWFIREPRRQATYSESGSLREFGTFLKRQRRLLAHHFLGFPVLATAVFAVQSWTAVYMIRHFKMDPVTVGLVMGAAIGVFGGVANVIAGRVVDVLLARGWMDAYYRVHVVTTLIAIPLLVGAYLVQDVVWFVALFCLGKGFLTSFGGASMATLQTLAPTSMRGKLAALYLLVLALLGSGLGPLLTAIVTELLLEDRALVGTSVLIVTTVAAGIGGLSLFFGMKPLRAAMAEQQPAG